VDQSNFPWRPLGALLVEEGLLSAGDLEHALEEQRRTGRLLGQILVARDCVTGVALARALARQHGVELRSVPGVEEAAASTIRAEPRVGGWRPLGDILVRHGYLTEAALRKGLAEQRERPGRRLGEVLVEGGHLSGAALASALAEQHGLDLGTEEALEAEVEMVPAPAAPRHPTYEVLAVAQQVGRPLYVSFNFLEAADFACDYVDRKQPAALEIQRRASGASETVWTYSQERADEASSSSKSLVETYGFDPTRWDVRL
jgi:hypothetical protein